MRTPAYAFIAAVVLACTTAASAAIPPPPAAKKIPVTDTYFGTTVVDPYRWMETGGPDFLAFLKAHNDRTRAILDSIPGRAAMANRLQALSETSNVSSGVVSRHGAYFYEKLPPGANSTKLYVRSGIGGAERVLVDPDTLSGPRQAISYFTPSNDGTHVAYGLSAGGSENATVHVVDVATGTTLPDSSDRADFGVTSWTDDGKSFFYLKRQEVAAGASPLAKYQNVRSYRHVLGQPGSTDVAVFGTGVNPNVTVPATSFAALGVAPESPYVAGILINGVEPFATIYAAPKSALANPATIPWKLVIRPEDKVTTALIQGSTVYALTAKDAPRFKIVKFDVTTGSIGAATDVIPAGTRVIDAVANASDALYVLSRENGLGRITRVGYDGAVRDIPLPVNGSISGLATEYDRPGFLAQLTSWTTAPLWYTYDANANALVDTKLDPPSPVDFSNVVAEEVTVPASDGTQIPLSIVHRRDMKRDGSNPTLLYAYGSYGISSPPGFSASRMAWFDHGGVYAVAHVRGGGEYGEEWHLAGKDANKVKTISDFVDCGKWLVAQKYTSPGKLGARGGSAGGITMGGAITTAPQLFAAVLDEIPVSDQLRIETTPNGPPNVPEFGSVKSEQGFRNLYATSAVQHVVKGAKYPAVMLTTGINDPRVDPWQAAKMAATLQDATASGRPILLRVDYEGGHGLIGSGRSQAVALTADEYAFLLWQFGTPGFQPTL
ncbi:MAG TPA: prolyl oligopeptidase family serine peptidase [Candidatus Elarobacter sp.]|jgi:prolyl oligopeptidase|nr:prolyl oligopeptidase family serine peptidase [Candidatus Elarobacter sp.]